MIQFDPNIMRKKAKKTRTDKSKKIKSAIQIVKVNKSKKYIYMKHLNYD